MVQGRMPLHCAAEHDAVDVVALLLACSTDIDAQDCQVGRAAWLKITTAHYSRHLVCCTEVS